MSGRARFVAGEGDDGVRLDAFLTERLSPVTRSRVQRWIDDGRVTLDGRCARAGAKLKSGAVAEVDVPAPRPLDLRPEAIPLEVLHEDADVIVVVKPAGMSTHPGAGIDSGTLVNALLARCPDLTGIGDALRPGIVHRLDKDTSGVLVVAKSERAHQSLSRQFHDRTAKRRYDAIAWGSVPASMTIDARIGRDPRERKRFAVVAEPAGRRAVTHVRLVERLRGASLLECRLETGRTHQIRVHLASRGFPLAGDKLYGRKSKEDPARQMLHARLLGFEHPATNEYVELEVPPPADFRAFLESRRSEA